MATMWCAPQENDSVTGDGEVCCCTTDRAELVRTEEGLVRVNEYDVKKEIGCGTFGEVYLCKHSKEGQEYAVKVVLRESYSDAEVRILKRVQHPNVVRLVEFIDDTEVPEVFLVFEMLKGGPIASLTGDGYMREESWSEEKARPLFLQMANGLRYLHSEGVVHRDIKPENFVFNDDHTVVKIIDFGESRLLRDEFSDDSTRVTAGTPFFHAPEMLQGGYFPGMAVDVWALGVLFHTLIHGHVPFGAGATSLMELWESIEGSNLELPAGPLGEMLGAMLRRDITRRVTLPALVNHRWFAEDEDRVGESDVLSWSSISVPSSPISPTGFGGTPRRRSFSSQMESMKKASEKKPHVVRILVVDDTHYQRAMLVRIMKKIVVPSEQCSLEVHEACSGRSAVRAMVDAARNGAAYSLVFLDMFLADSDALAVTSAVREVERDENLTETPVLLTTTEEERPLHLKEALEKAGIRIKRVLTKPFHQTQVSCVLRSVGVDTRADVPPQELSRPRHIADSFYMQNSLQREMETHDDPGEDAPPACFPSSPHSVSHGSFDIPPHCAYLEAEDSLSDVPLLSSPPHSSHPAFIGYPASSLLVPCVTRRPAVCVDPDSSLQAPPGLNDIQGLVPLPFRTKPGDDF